MDLRQAYEAAQANDAQIRAARSGAEASRERLPQARAQLLPNVSLSAERNHNDLTSKGRNFAGDYQQKQSITRATRPCLCASGRHRPAPECVGAPGRGTSGRR